MKHPIYTDSILKLLNNYEESFGTLNELLAHLDTDTSKNDKEFTIRGILAIKLVKENGHNLITLSNNDDWQETLSIKTFRSMKVEDLLLPYEGFAISVQKGFHQAVLEGVGVGELGYVLVGKIEGTLNLLATVDVEGSDVQGWQVRTLEPTELISADLGDNVWTEELLFKIVSICMYATTFKKDKSRVLPVKEVLFKGSKRKNIPRHTTSTVILKQPQYKLEGKSHTTSHSKSNKMWMVRGHWRNQPFGKYIEGEERKTKLTFIDPHWRGEGSEVMIREVRI